MEDTRYAYFKEVICRVYWDAVARSRGMWERRFGGIAGWSGMMKCRLPPPVVGEPSDVDGPAADVVVVEETIIETVTDDAEPRENDE